MPPTEPTPPGPGPLRQRAVYLAGLRGRRPAVPADPQRLEEAARRTLSPEAFAYIAGGAGQERTMEANRAGFERWRIVPRMLRDVSDRDLRVTLFGRTLPAPLLLAPVGVMELAHPEADLAVARAAADAGLPMIFSSQASVPMEACAAAMGDGPRWFQLYWSTENALVESFVRRAEACGCDALVLTLDTTLLGWRVRDLDRAYLPFLHGKGLAQYTSDPVFQRLLDETSQVPPEETPRLNAAVLRAAVAQARAYPGSTLNALRSGRARAAVQLFTRIYARPSLTWDDLAWLRSLTALPILLKGILHPDDARQAVAHGISGIIVSNHGGRQVDGAISSIEALPGIVAAVEGQVPVLLDSGIRSGADVFKALALGAAAVCLGRPYVYGLAVAGQAGVQTVLRNVVADVDLTMGLAGCRSVDEVTAALLDGPRA
ncbi:lactate 2-monooxygenase [Rhodothermaceae bacterium RA]|nr:lactate 2-monooxygenase [Rhodothermaceae bacterium RA]